MSIDTSGNLPFYQRYTAFSHCTVLDDDAKINFSDFVVNSQMLRPRVASQRLFMKSIASQKSRPRGQRGQVNVNMLT